MTAAALLASARESGVTVRLDATGTLRVGGPTAALDCWVPQLREVKPALLELLTPHAPTTTMRCYRVLVAMGDSQPPKWATLVAPGCTPEDARHDAEGRFYGRVMEIHEHRTDGEVARHE